MNKYAAKKKTKNNWNVEKRERKETIYYTHTSYLMMRIHQMMDILQHTEKYPVAVAIYLASPPYDDDANCH